MSTPTHSPVHVFLVQPLSKDIHKEMIVYADNEQAARVAAESANTNINQHGRQYENPTDTVYLNGGMSICIEIEPNILKPDSNSQHLHISYNGVRYDLTKNIAQQVIAERLL